MVFSINWPRILRGDHFYALESSNTNSLASTARTPDIDTDSHTSCDHWEHTKESRLIMFKKTMKNDKQVVK